ncbi:MAG: DUF3343 domain-containing protein [Candidatus Xenobiia bacterium LiM19]
MDDSYCVATFKSIHLVMKSEQLLKERGIWTDMIPNPRTLVADCGMALLFYCRDAVMVQAILGGDCIPPSNIFRKEGREFVILEGGEDRGCR